MKINIETIFIGKTKITTLGVIFVAASTKGLIATQIGGNEEVFSNELNDRYHLVPISSKNHVETYLQQIEGYLQGTRQLFDFPLLWEVMPTFQQKVLRAVYAIPYGETRTYGEIATQIESPRAARAVGRANATNPMPLVLPCHRLVGVDGSLRGYGSGEGIKTKAWLLDFEKENSACLS